MRAESRCCCGSSHARARRPAARTRAGGVYYRKPGSREPDGHLAEKAVMDALSKRPPLSPERLRKGFNEASARAAAASCVQPCMPACMHARPSHSALTAPSSPPPRCFGARNAVAAAVAVKRLHDRERNGPRAQRRRHRHRRDNHHQQDAAHRFGRVREGLSGAGCADGGQGGAGKVRPQAVWQQYNDALLQQGERAHSRRASARCGCCAHATRGGVPQCRLAAPCMRSQVKANGVKFWLDGKCRGLPHMHC